MKPPLDPEGVRIQLERLIDFFPVLPLTPAVVLEAVRGVRDYRFSYYDAQIWAAAKAGHASAILSEDFNSGGTVEGVAFINPFAPEFAVTDLG
jgi:predicted nucleic acid-binding protein